MARAHISTLWSKEYKPSLSTGSFGTFLYNQCIDFYPPTFSSVIQDEWKQKYIIEKLFESFDDIPFHIDCYYDCIKQYTFPTKFISFGPSTAQAMINFYRNRYFWSKSKQQSEYQLTILNIENIYQLNKILSNTIANAIKEWYGNNDPTNGVFIRLSNRSPKDGHKVNHDSNIGQSTSLEYKENVDINANDQFIQFCQNSMKSLLVNNGNDAMSLLLTSRRIFDDLQCVINIDKFPFKYLYFEKIMHRYRNINDNMNIVEFKSNENIKDNFSICDVKIAIRKFETDLKMDHEFRCFVYNGQMTAISQYNHYCYFSYLNENKNKLNEYKNCIIKYWSNKIKPVIKHDKYVIDIAILDKCDQNLTRYGNDCDSKYDCVVIELNPFVDTTGSCLFDWKKDENILKQYNAINVELRIQTQESVLSQQFVQRWIQDFDHFCNEISWFEYLQQIKVKLNNSKRENGVAYEPNSKPKRGININLKTDRCHIM